MKLSARLRLFTLGCTLLLVGCGTGASTCTVSGKVTSQGKPVYGGVISFTGANGEFASGGIDFEGNYLVYDAPVGSMKVAVVSDKPDQKANRARKNEAGAPPTAAALQIDPSKWFAIDKKYGDPATSGKEVKLSGGTNKIDIALE